jgi:hypothetical protein
MAMPHTAKSIANRLFAMLLKMRDVITGRLVITNGKLNCIPAANTVGKL